MTKIAIPLLAVLALTACETVKGAGRDMQAAGHAVTSEAAETQAEM
ncbi:entericidin A/B family lipoprotein [Rhodobacter lacus]|uniref:Entericidin A/B family lipoprotein n=1 Tax=Rhodobacter lacus TaxID=1641972 RepID=A0ABW5A4Z7_9RHOB